MCSIGVAVVADWHVRYIVRVDLRVSSIIGEGVGFPLLGLSCS